MHHIYHTEGLILASKNYREADKYYTVFTRDLGMIYASAQGIRKMSSKLRFILQDFSYLKIDLVRGKDFWRITSASKTNQLEDLRRPEILATFLNISKLLKRLLAGEDPNPELFEDLINGLGVLEKTSNLAELRDVEVIIILRLLNNLGYLGGGDFQNLVKSPLEKELIFTASKNRTKILQQINRALEESHL